MGERGRHRLAVVAAFATFLLLTVGGFVTSLDAGMVFIDWPLSDGSINPEGWTRDPDMLSEHGHRILGALVGMLTIAVAVTLQRSDPRRPVRVLGWVALVAVIAQGVLGGLRVTEVSAELALLHGCTGQLYFCLMVALAYLTSRDALRTPEPGPDTRSLSVTAAAVLFVVFMQVVLGAQLRHINGPVQFHIFGAILVAGSILWLLSKTLLGHGGRRALTLPVLFLAALLLAQVALGLTSAAVLRAYAGGEPSLAQVLLPSFHQACGALMLATSLVVMLRSVRRNHPALRAEVAL